MTKTPNILVRVVALLLLVSPVAAHTLWLPVTNGPFAVMGYGLAESYGRIYLINGFVFQSANSNQEFDPVTATWALRANRPVSAVNVFCTAVTLPTVGFQLIFVGGGSQGWQQPLHQYYAPTDEWAARPNHPFLARSGAVAADLGDGKMHILGGYTDEGERNDHAIYDPITFTWSAAAPIPNLRGPMGAAVEDGKWRVAGGHVGRPGGWTVLRGHAIYDPQTDTWTTQPDVPAAEPFASTGLNVEGVFHFRSGATHARYDSASGTWTLLPSHPYNVIGEGAAIDGVPVWFGGQSGSQFVLTPLAFYESALFLDSTAPFGGNGLPDTPFRDFSLALAAVPPQHPRLVMLVARPGVYAEIPAYNFDRPIDIRKWGAGGDVQIRE